MPRPFILTLVAARDATSLSPGTIAAARDAVGGGPPVILAEAEAVDIPCAQNPDLARVRAALRGAPIDTLATEATGRRKSLLVADMDSTIVTSETLDELAAQAGIGEQVAAITRRSMNGEIDFAAALRERVAMLEGLDLAALDEVWRRTQLTPGALTLVATMAAHGARTALVSGGFTWFTSRVAALCGFDSHHANTLLDDGQALTGAVGEPILDRGAKLTILRQLVGERGTTSAAALATGDGANDLAMLTEAGLGIAFHAKPVVAEAARNRVDHADLRALLFAQGFFGREIREE